MAYLKFHNQEKVTTSETPSTKRNFAFIISAALLVVTIFLFRSAVKSQDQQGTLTPQFEYPVLFYLEGSAVLYDKPTLYGRLLVLEDASQPYRYLVIDGIIHNSWDYRRKLTSGWLKNISEFFVSESRLINDVAMVGLGAGTLLREWDGADFSVDVVEINPKVQEVAEQYFGMPENLDYRIILDDGRHFIRTTQKKYDVLILDLCDISGANAHLFTKEYYELAKTKLTENGFIIVTIFMLNREDTIPLGHRIARTLNTSFENIYIMQGGEFLEGATQNAGSVGIVNFLATDATLSPELINQQGMQRWAERDVEVITDDTTAQIVRAHEPVLEALRADLIKSYGTEIFLER